jgi:hypothetical protein
MNNIAKLNMSTLSIIDNEEINLGGFENSLSIDHYSNAKFSSSTLLGFSIEVSPSTVPLFEEEDFHVVIREKVNLASDGPYENAVTKIGSKEYENKKINKLKTLPRGFKEIKGYN